MSFMLAVQMCLLVEIFLLGMVDTTMNLHRFHCGSCTCHQQDGETYADCSDKGLSIVPYDLPVHIVGLDLSQNNINNFGKSLRKYRSLVNINASHTGLHVLNRDDFAGLFKLTILDLQWNHLTLSNSTYPQGLFRHQQHLSALMLHGNSKVEEPGLQYPDETLSNLIGLENLTIDGLFNPLFGKGFLHLIRLSTLIVTGNCYMRTLSNATLLFLPYLRFLSIKGCVLTYIEPGSFLPLRSIHELDLSDNVYLGLPSLGLGMYGLQNSSIKILRANRLNTHHGVGVEIRNSDVQYLRNTELEELYLDSNRIDFLDSEVILNLPSALKKLSVKNNIFIFGMYILTGSVLKNLTWLDVSKQHHSYAEPFSVEGNHYALVEHRRCAPIYHNDRNELMHNFSLHNYRPDSDLQGPWPGSFTIYIPPNLTFANFSNSKLSFAITRVRIGQNNLKVIDFSHNFFTRWEGPIIGLEKLKYIDLSHNYCDKVSDTICLNFDSLIKINVSFNFLGYSLTNKTFEPTKKLQLLDLSNNKISRLPQGFLHNLNSLEHLNLSSNYLTIWNINICHMVNLTELDLSSNFFEELPLELESQLQMIKHSSLNVSFNNNPLKCGCFSLISLKWIEKYGREIINLNGMTCTFHDGSQRGMDKLPDIILELDKLCTSYVGVMFGVLCLLLLTVFILISGLVYRYRWRLRYLYYLAVYRHKGNLSDLPQNAEHNFEFDAFVSYADEDRSFVVRDMRQILEEPEEPEERFRLCIHHRYFLPGEAIAANILKAINISRKTVVILTRNFLKSYWCRYEVEMAKMEGIYRGRNTLLIVVMEDIPVKDLPADIVEVMKNDSYVEFTNDEDGQRLFWVNLKRAIHN